MDADELVVTVQEEGTSCRVIAVGDLTAFTCRRLSDAVVAAVEQGSSSVELDLSDVTFIDSSGVQCLVQARRAAADHDDGRVKVTGMSTQVRRVLEVTGLLGPLTGGDPP